MDEISPLAARIQFRSVRDAFKNAIYLGIFGIVVLTAASVYLWPNIGLMEDLALVFLSLLFLRMVWIYFAVRRTARFNLFCPKCSRHTASDTTWTCSYCDHRNTMTGRFSFLYRCENCKKAPNSYECPKCREPIFLNRQNDGRHPAIIQLIEELEPDAILEERRKAHQEQKEGLEHEIEITALSKQLAQLKLSPEFRKEVSAKEKIEKDFSEYDSEMMGVRMLERSLRLKYAVEFRGDPDLLDMKNEVMDEFVSKFGLPPNRNIRP